MNQGGVPYTISGGDPSSGSYSTNFQLNVKGPVEHFDVYGEVRTKYSQVYWTRNTPIELPPELVSRFKGKTMAITGYEIDQVTHSAPANSSTKGDVLGGFSCMPDCGETDKSVPIYNAYNHHYFSWLVGADSEVYERELAETLPNPTRTGIRDKPGYKGYPTNIVFKENPGGEYRKSYHGYPSGYAQLIHSPTQWLVEPMQIDTHNRNYDINDPVGYKPWFLPKRDQNSSETDLSIGLSPLIECPCSDRITRSVVNSSSILTSGKCQATISSEEECAAAVSKLAQVSWSKAVNNASLPAGCLLVPVEVTGEYGVIFNSAQSEMACDATENTWDNIEGISSGLLLRGDSDLGGLVNLSVVTDGTSANITLSGPDGAWYGVGFDAAAMSDEPYAIIVDGAGAVTERKLGNHAPGDLLSPSVVVVESRAVAGVRTVVVTRPVKGLTPKHYSIPTAAGGINLITAIGSGPELAYHKARTGASVTLLPVDVGACICAPVSRTFLTYMNTSTQEFNVNCVDEPRSDMLRKGDGTGRPVENAACKMQTYHGGLKCCQHTFFLTDLEQDAQIPQDKVDVYFLKWRYYFQEYVPATETAPASHRHLHHWVFLIDADVNDYEEDNAEYGKGSVGSITAHLTGREIGLEDIPTNYSGITPLVMTPHCHAPSCIREEFWNADTNELICNVTAMYADVKYGALSDVFNEANYITIPPCLFGDQPGLRHPVTLKPDTNIRAVKYFNNTFRHLGQMAQWTGLMVYDTDPY